MKPVRKRIIAFRPLLALMLGVSLMLGTAFMAQAEPGSSPVISSISPARGPSKGGQITTITGQNFSMAQGSAGLSGDWMNNVGKTLPGNLAYSQLAVIGDRVYLFGGHNGASYSNAIYSAQVSDPTTWTNTGKTLPGNLGQSQLAIIGDQVYLFGGSSNVIYSASTSDPTTWTNTGKTLPGNLAYSQLAIIGDRVYLFGGHNGTGFTGSIYSAPTSNPTNWTSTGKALPAGLAYSQLAVIGDRVYLFGGTSSSNTNAIYSAQVSDPTAWTNTNKTLPAGLSHSQLAIIGDQVYLFGGSSNVIYSASTSDPTTWTNTGKTLPGNLSQSQLALIGDKAYLFGGSSSSVIYSSAVTNPGGNLYNKPWISNWSSDTGGQASVMFGGVRAASVTQDTSSSLSVTTPAHAPGIVDLTVTNSDGSTTVLPGGYEFVDAPTVSSITPNSGSMGGGDTVAITGAGFTADTKVYIGNNLATNVTLTSSTALSVTVPASTKPGMFDVRVEDEFGQASTLPAGYTYYMQTPTITAISPNTSKMTGGGTATISGTGFVPQTAHMSRDYQAGGDVQTTWYTFSRPIKEGDSVSLYVSGDFSDGTKCFTLSVDDIELRRTCSNTTQNPVVANLTDARSIGTITLPATLYGKTTVKVKGETTTQVHNNQSPAARDWIVFNGDGIANSWYDVSFGTEKATNVTYVDANTLRAVIPRSSQPNIVDVSLSGAYINTATLTKSFTYLPEAYSFVNTPLQLAATQPGKLVIEARDREGNPLVVPYPLEITLTSNSQAGFFARDMTEDPATRWDYSSVILPAGKSSVDVWYKDSTPGTPTITAKVNNQEVASQQQYIGSRYLFEVTGVSDPIRVGVPSSITVRVVDYAGQPLTGYVGTIHFDSSDIAASLPANYRMTASDNGVKTFVNGVTMLTQGEHRITATDTESPTTTGSQQNITVLPPNDGTITQLKIISNPPRFPSNGYSSPITVQAQDSAGEGVPVDAPKQVYMFTDSTTGEFATDPINGPWVKPAANGSFAVTIPTGMTATSVYYRDTSVRTSIISARDRSDDTADYGEAGDFAWKNDAQQVISGVGAPTKLFIDGPGRLESGEKGRYYVELQDAAGNPVTAESDISIRIDGDTDTSRFYFSESDQPRAGPDRFIIPGGATHTYIWFSDTTPSTLPDGATTIAAVDDRPTTETVRLSDATKRVKIGVGAPHRLEMLPISTSGGSYGQPVRKNTSLRANYYDIYGNVTFIENESADVTFATSASGVFNNTTNGQPTTQFTVTPQPGDTGVEVPYYALTTGLHTITASAPQLTSDTKSFEASAITPVIRAPAKGVQVKEASRFRLSFEDASKNPITLDAAQTSLSLALSHTSGAIAPKARATPPGGGALPSVIEKSGGGVIATVLAGENFIEFEYSDSELGQRTMTATSEHNGVNETVFNFEVVAGDYDSLYFPDGEQIFAAGEPKRFRIGFLDKHGTPTIVREATTIRLSSDSIKGDFSLAAEPFASIPAGAITIPAGTKEFEVYYYDESVGRPTVTARDSSDYSGIVEPDPALIDPTTYIPPQNPSNLTKSQIHTVTAGKAVRYVIESEGQMIAKDTPSGAITVGLRDRFGHVASAGADGLTATIDSTSASGEFAHDTNGGTGTVYDEWKPAGQLVFRPDALSAEIHYRDSSTGIHTLSATSSGMTSGSQDIEIVKGFPERASLYPSASSLVAGGTIPVRIQLEMGAGVPVAATRDGRVALSATSDAGPSGEFSLTADPFVPIEEVEFKKYDNEKVVYFRTTLVAPHTLTTSAGSSNPSHGLSNIEPSSTTIMVQPAEYARLDVASAWTDRPLKYATELSVTQHDLYGNVTMSDTQQTVHLSTDTSTGELAAKYPELNWQSQRLSLTMPAYTNTVVAYARETQFQTDPTKNTLVVTASDTNPADSPDMGILNGSVGINIISQPVASIRFVNAPHMIQAGQTTPAMTIEFVQPNGEPAIQSGAPGGTPLTSFSPTGDSGRVQTMAGAPLTSTDTVRADRGTAVASIAYYGVVAGTHTVQAGVRLGEPAWYVQRSTSPLPSPDMLEPVVNPPTVTQYDELISQPVVVTPGPAASLDITTLEQSIRAGEASGEITLEFRDNFGTKGQASGKGNLTTTDQDYTISLTSSCSQGVFSKSASPWEDGVSFVVPAGTSQYSFYYKDFVSAQCLIEVTAVGLEKASQSITVDPGAPTRIDIMEPGKRVTKTKGENYQMPVQMFDLYGNVAWFTDQKTIQFTTTSTTGAFTSTTKTFDSGQFISAPVYRDVMAGEARLTVSDQADQLTPDSIDITMNDGAPAELRMTPTDHAVKANQVYTGSVGLYNAFGIPLRAVGDTIVTLSSTSTEGSGTFIDSAALPDRQAVSSVVIAAGEQSASVAYVQTKAETVTLEASLPGVVSGTAQLTVAPESLHEMRIINQPYTGNDALQLGERRDAVVGFYDIYGNLTNPGNIPLYVTSASGIIPAVQTHAAASTVPLSLLGDTVGATTLTVSTTKDPLDSGAVVPAVTQNVEVVYGSPHKITLEPENVSLVRGDVKKVDFTLRNLYGRQIPGAAGGTTMQVKGSSDDSNEGLLSSTRDGVFSPQLAVTIAEGQWSAEAYYRNDNAKIWERACYTSGPGQSSRSCSVSHYYGYYLYATLPGISDSIPVSISHGSVARYEITTPEREVFARHTSDPITVRQVNQFGIVVPALSDTPAYVRSSSPTGEFGASPTEWGINQVVILNNATEAQLYYRDSKMGRPLLTIADSLPLVPDTGTTNAAQYITVKRQVLDHLYVTNISDPQKQGTPSSVIVMARDSENYLVDWYDGTVSFSSDDPGAVLPDSYTFSPARDKGSKTFTNQVAFGSPGEKIVTASDGGSNSSAKPISGSQVNITVEAGNVAPVAALRFTQPESPAKLVRNVASPPLTVQLFDKDNLPTTAPVGGMPIRLTATSATGQLALSPAGPWQSVLSTNVPEGFTFLNVYYRDTEMGSARISATDWIGGIDNKDIANATLDVEVSTVYLRGDVTISSQNVFGAYEESALLFATDAQGSISGSMKSNFSSYSLETDEAKPVDWRWYWREGVELRDSDFTIRGTDKISKNKTSIKTKAGGRYWYSTAEATDTTFDKPREVVSRELEIPVGRHTVELTASPYVVVNSPYQFSLTTYHLFKQATVPELQVVMVPEDATDLSRAVYQTTVQPTGARTTVTIPQTLPELGQLGGRYRVYIAAKNTKGDTLAQALSEPVTVVDSIPEPPIVPGLQPPVLPGGTVTPEGNVPLPDVSGGVLTPSEPSKSRSPSPVQPDRQPVDEENPTAVPVAKKPAIHPALSLPVPVVATLITADTFLVIALIREAYKELARVYHVRRLLARQRLLAEEKDTFLRLASHYLRAPIATLEAAITTDRALTGSASAHGGKRQLEAVAELGVVVGRLRKHAEVLLEGDAARSATRIIDPNIKKATVTALRSPFFWLPLVLSVGLTIALNWLLEATAAGQIHNDAAVYTVIIMTAVALIVGFSLRTIYLNNERRRLQESFERYRKRLFAAKNTFIDDVEKEMSKDIERLQKLTTQPGVIRSEQLTTPIATSVAKLNDLSAKLRLIRRINGVTSHVEAINPDELLVAVVNQHNVRLAGKPTRHRGGIKGGKRMLQDRRLLRYVLSSVIDNATKVGRLSGAVRVTSRISRGMLTVRVHDEGGGLGNARTLEQIFEPHNNQGSMQQDKTAESMGLTMYLNKLILTQLGGTIAATESRDGTSTTVELSVPLVGGRPAL